MIRFRRNLVIAGGVVIAHAAALWVFQSGSLRRPVEVIVPVRLVGEFALPAAAATAPQPTPAPVPPPTSIAVVAKPSAVRTAAPSLPRTLPPTPDPGQVPSAPVVAPAASAVPPPPVSVTVAVVAAPPVPAQLAPAVPARVELPSRDAQYLQVSEGPYPPISKRLGEQGQVLVRVLIGVDGNAQKAEIERSSGFERLDQAALEKVLQWRYVPGKQAGVAQAMWFTVPVAFVLK